jgi:hypothetical protein
MTADPPFPWPLAYAVERLHLGERRVKDIIRALERGGVRILAGTKRTPIIFEEEWCRLREAVRTWDSRSTLPAKGLHRGPRGSGARSAATGSTEHVERVRELARLRSKSRSSSAVVSLSDARAQRSK